MISVKQKGTFNNVIAFLEKYKSLDYESLLMPYAKKGIEALKRATPVKTGKTANSWSYEIEKTMDGVTISWKNSNTTNEGIPIVLLIVYGHATNRGYYIKGNDFISPTIKPIFEDIAVNAWKEVNR